MDIHLDHYYLNCCCCYYCVCVRMCVCVRVCLVVIKLYLTLHDPIWSFLGRDTREVRHFLLQLILQMKKLRQTR